MRPLVTKVVIIGQEINDPNNPWAQAQFNWFKQLSIQYDKLDPTKFCDPPLPQTISGGNPVTKKIFAFKLR